MTGINFNDTKESVAERTKSTNYEGGPSYDPDSVELALTKNVINNLLEDSFYEDGEDSFDDVIAAFENCAEENPEFVLKLAKYARQEENLRQIPQVLLVLAANHDAYRDTGLVRAYAPSIMSRADEPLEALAMQESMFGKTIPHSLKMGIEDAMHQWNEYQYAKWDRSSREWQYRDLFNLVHPKPRDDEREEIFKKIAKGDLDKYEDVEPLRQKDTWEDEMSEAGKSDEDPATVWRRQLRENEDGYSMPIFARVRNVRNMLQAGLTGEEIFGDECGPAVSDEWIRNSRMWPFRFYQAYKAVREDFNTPNDRAALDWLEHAIDISADNIPDAFDNTLAVVDTSGSMSWSAISNESNMTPMEIGALFGAIMVAHDSDVAAFASRYRDLNLDPRDTLMTNMNKIMDANVGGGTSGHLIPQSLRNEGRQYDKVIVFTDLQMWGGGFETDWKQYKSTTSPESSLYLVDLASYGDLVTPEGAQDVYNISGWSDSVLDYIAKMENVGEMIASIEKVEP